MYHFYSILFSKDKDVVKYENIWKNILPLQLLTEMGTVLASVYVQSLFRRYFAGYQVRRSCYAIPVREDVQRSRKCTAHDDSFAPVDVGLRGYYSGRSFRMILYGVNRLREW